MSKWFRQIPKFCSDHAHTSYRNKALAAHADDNGRWNDHSDAARHNAGRQSGDRRDGDNRDNDRRDNNHWTNDQHNRGDSRNHYSADGYGGSRPSGDRGYSGVRGQDQRTQIDKNAMRNVGYASGVAAVFGILTHNNAVAALGGIGAVVAGTQYEKDRKQQNNNDHYGDFHRDSNSRW